MGHWEKTTALSILIIFIHLTFHESCESANILFLHPMSTPSHAMVTWPLATALSSKGHSVSYISVVQPPESHPNISVIIPRKAKESVDSLFELSFSYSSRIYMRFLPLHPVLPVMKGLGSQALFTSIEFQNWMDSSPKVDLIIVDSLAEFGLALAAKFGSKVIVFSVTTFPMELLENLGVPEQLTSSIESPSNLQDRSSFFSRFKHEIGVLATSLFLPIGRYWIAYNAKQYLNMEASSSSLHEQSIQLKNVSLVMYNGFPFEEHQKSLPPNFVSVGGIHIRETNGPLEKNVEEFLGNSTGFIYSSLGTFVDLNSLPVSTENAFIEAIEQFPQVKFLWKWDKPRPKHVPANLFLAKWFNQQDVLSDSRILGFITQAGRPSLQESLYHGVPMITLPILADQDYNAMMLEDLGVSINMEILTATSSQLKSSLTKLLSSDILKSRALEISRIIRDTPMKPVDTALWWTEYVLRHENTAHLQSTGIGESSLYKKNLDVWVFLLIILSMVIISIYRVARIVCGAIIYSKANKPKTE